MWLSGKVFQAGWTESAEAQSPLAAVVQNMQLEPTL